MESIHVLAVLVLKFEVQDPACPRRNVTTLSGFQERLPRRSVDSHLSDLTEYEAPPVDSQRVWCGSKDAKPGYEAGVEMCRVHTI